MFDVFFFADTSPFLLLFGAKVTNFGFEIKVHPGFNIDCKLDPDVYKRLCKILNLKYDPRNPFTPKKFFSEFNLKIPQYALGYQKAKPQDISPYKSISEESDKVYFCGWLDNSKRNNNVRQSNLDKTRQLLGEKLYIRCKEKNISSCWTDKKEKATEITTLF